MVAGNIKEIRIIDLCNLRFQKQQQQRTTYEVKENILTGRQSV